MMMRTSARVLLVLLSAAAILPGRTRAAQGAFTLEETTIAEAHAAFRAKRLTCRALVDAYVTRIEGLDQRSTLNAIVVVNPAVRQEADALDTRFAASGPTGPLHCVPVIVKDNFETIGLQSAAGSLALQGFISGRDAFQVQRLRAAGALVLAKSNMAEFAFSPYETVNSLRGITRNPYALERVPAGSSGGTAAAVSANFGLVGLGSDTGNSIRGPSAHTALVGIRSTMGLTSRAGVIPLSFLADIAGPMTRTVTDAARVFQVIVGEDPADPVTARSRGRAPVDYMAALSATALRGARLGVLRQAYERTNAPVDPEVVAVFERAIADLRKAGAEVIDPAAVDLTNVRRAQGAGTCRGFKYDIDEYLATRGGLAPVHSLEEILASPHVASFPASVQQRLTAAQRSTPQGPDSEACRADREYRDAYGAAVTAAMDTLRLDAFIYPTWSQVPRLIAEATRGNDGDNSQQFSPTSGFPAITVPMGFTRGDTLPAGLTLFGRAWHEARLFGLAFSYEQSTRHRRPPALDDRAR